jgi:SAM-dependent methyltransferase
MKRLHFGCFNCPHDGWTNTDVTPHLLVSRVPGLAWLMYKLGLMTEERRAEHRKGVYRGTKYLNVTKPWGFGDEIFDAIYSSHVLEHLPLWGAKVCLTESHRCLKKGGVVRISVPDLDAFIQEYAPAQSMQWATRFFEANERSEKNMHHFMYNFESLAALLKESGFTKVVRRAFREGSCPDVEKIDNRPGSLFVEAFK